MRRRAIIQLAIALLVLAGVCGAYAFWYVQVGKESAEAASLAEQIRMRVQDSARAKEAEKALASLASDEASIRGYLIRQEDVVPFLGTLEGMGSRFGSSVEVVSVSSEDGPARGRVLLSLRIAGSFDAVVRTLGAIEYGPYDSAVQNVTLDTSTSEGGGRSWTASATFAIGTEKGAATP
ncbi:MAG: hypothetical protein ACSLE1_02925 [Sphingobium sp.]